MEENLQLLPRKCKDGGGGGMGMMMMGLPPIEDLIPLTQSLISPELASAFGIHPPPHTPTTPTSTFTHTPNRSTTTNRRREEDYSSSSFPTTTTRLEPLKLFPENTTTTTPEPDPNKISRTRVAAEPLDSGGFHDDENSNSASGGDENGGLSSSTGRGGGVKRPRLVWTPQLHKRFVDVIEHLGVEKAVPKTIMEMMNVEGLTRENVASHLQKYRLYLKRVERVATSPVAADLSLGGRRGGGGGSGYDCFGGIGNGFGHVPGQIHHTPPPPPPGGLQCNGLNLMPVPPSPGVGGGSPYLAEVGVRRIGGYGSGGNGGQLGLGVGGSSGGGGGGVSPQAGYCGLESGGFGTVFWNRQRG